MLQRLLPPAALLSLWQAACALRLLPADAVSPPSAILDEVWGSRALYARHVSATLLPAAAGFVIGNAIAILLAIGFTLSRPLERILRGLTITLFAIPPITLGPLLVVSFHGIAPQVILAAICVYFPTLTATLVGLREIDPRSAELVRLYGGGELAILRWVRLRAALPAVLAGLRVAGPASILGALLAEFGSGAPGLGSLLLTTMSMGDPARLWAIATVATLLSASIYGLVSILAARTVGATVPINIALSRPPGDLHRTLRQRILSSAATMLTVAIPLALWQALPWMLGVSAVVVKTPLSVWAYVVSGPDAADARSALWDALGQSLPLALLGLLCGLAAAFLLALAACQRPALARPLMPGALLLQSMPLVALTPLIVLMFGRGSEATLVVATSVTFFPAFVTISEGMRLVPRAAHDVLRLYGATQPQHLRMVTLPASLPYLCAAARLVAPSALLGVLTAEWLATGYGLGNLLNEARGSLDYGMIWTVAFVTVALSGSFFAIVQGLESFLLARQTR